MILELWIQTVLSMTTALSVFSEYGRLNLGAGHANANKVGMIFHYPLIFVHGHLILQLMKSILLL